MSHVETTRSAEHFELTDRNPGSSWHESEARTVSALPRADGGKEAWLILSACFVVEALVWGFPFAFGVFQTYYASHEPFASEPTGIPAIATTSSGIGYLGAPFVATLVQRWPLSRKPMTYCGTVVILASLIGGSYSNSVTGLLATQGVLYGLAISFVYIPVVSILDEWFIAKKGLAYGVMWAGTGTSGAIVPFLVQWLLDHYGFRTALRVWAVIVAMFMVPTLYVLRPRLPVTASNRVRPMDWSYLKSSAFWFFELGTIFQGLGFFLPQLWIPTFADSMEFPAFSGPLALALSNLAAVAGCLVLGHLSDRFDVTVAISVATLGSMIGAFVFWGLSTSQPMLYLFMIIWGFFAAGYTTTWSGCANSLRRQGNSNIDTGAVISLMAAGKGIGAIASGPLSERLLQSGIWESAEFAYGTSYGVLVVFTGISATLGGTAWLGRQLRLL